MIRFALLMFFVCAAIGNTAAHARSPLCTENGIAKISFTGMAAVKAKGDLCAVDSKSLPSDVISVIRKMGQVHTAIAKSIGQSLKETVEDGFSISFSASTSGSIGSYALRDGSGVVMTQFGDTPLNEWSSQTYAHELMHVLTYRKGAFAVAMTGLEEHPFISEALPDLVSIDVHDDVIVKFEAGLAPCFVMRDATPNKSLAQTFQDFYTFAASDRLQSCCDSLTSAQKTKHALGICEAVKQQSSEGYYAGMKALGATITEPTAADLKKPFRFSQCLFQIKGWDMLQGCGSHSFAEPLSSFFMALKKDLKRSLVADWVRILKKQAPQLTRYSCAYTQPVSNAKPASVILRGVTSSLKALRDLLSNRERAIFDRVWAAHDFDQLKELDTLFLNHSARTFSLSPLSSVNSEYANEHRCSSVYAIDAAACDVACVETR